jgi:Na+/H+-dicarboxylate symporter
VSDRLRPGLLTVGSLGGLAAGLTAGLLAHHTRNPLLLGGASALEPIGTLWVNALRMMVLPLIVSHLFVAVASLSTGRGAGRLGGLTLGWFLILHAAAFAFALAVSPVFISWFRVDAASRALFEAPAAAAGASPAAPGGFGDFFTGVIPTNAFASAARDDVLGVIVFTAVLALATRQIPAEQRQLVIGLFRALATATKVVVRWILLALPIGVFAIAYALTANTGFDTAGAVGYYVLVVSVMMVLFTLLLYPITAVAGRVPMRRFAWAVAPSQAVALGTRSSLASLPALMTGAEQRLQLPTHVSAFALPLAVSTFKVNRGVSSILKLLFLAHFYGLTIEPGFIVVFVLTITLLSFSSPGIPGGGTMTSAPVYLAAGIPLEGLVLIEAVDAVPDMFKTLVNVTADMTVAAVVARFVGAAVAVDPVAVPVRGAAAS